MASVPQSENSLSPLVSNGEVQESGREATGRFARGHRIKGGGRPKGEGIVPHLNDLIDNCGRGRKYAETLDQLAIKGKTDAVRLQALSEIMDRIHGKPLQSVRHAGVFIVAAPGAEALAALDSWSQNE